MKEYSIPRQIWRALYPILIFLGASFVVSFAASFIAGIVFAVVHLDDPNPYAISEAMIAFMSAYSLWFVLIANAMSIIIFALMWRKIRLTLQKYDNTKLSILTVILTILSCAGFNLILVSTFEITNLVQYFPSYDAVAEMLTSGSLLVRILAIAVAAPIVEELLCRGIVLNRLLSWMPKWVAILVGSALFGIIHFNLLQGLYAFVVGIAFSVLYLRYRNLWIPIIGHAAFNLANVVLIEIIDTMGVEINIWLLLIPGALITLACVVLFAKRTTAATPVQEPII